MGCFRRQLSVQPSLTPPLPTEASAPRRQERFGLRLDVYPPPQVLQIDGRLYHLTPASHFAEGVMNSRAPLLHRRYPASTLIPTQPPPSRLRPTSRGHRLYELPCSADFSVGRGRLLQLLSVSLSPCCPYHPAGVSHRFSQNATVDTAFARHQQARPPEFISCRGHLWVHFRCGPVTRSPSLSMALLFGFRSFGFPPVCESSYGASDSCPDGIDSH